MHFNSLCLRFLFDIWAALKLPNTRDTRFTLLFWLPNRLVFFNFPSGFIDRCAKRLRWNWMWPEIGTQMKYTLENVKMCGQATWLQSKCGKERQLLARSLSFSRSLSLCCCLCSARSRCGYVIMPQWHCQCTVVVGVWEK